MRAARVALIVALLIACGSAQSSRNAPVVLDHDGDGVPDARDDCPMVPEDLDGVLDTDGCPESGPTDRDGDGIMDATDRCPDDPEDRDGFEDEDGCPEPDNDRDGILDVDDQCPNYAELMNGILDTDGCPP